MKTIFIRFAGNDSGVTAIEYGLIAGLVVIGIISAVTGIGINLAAKFFGPAAAGLT